MSEFYQILIAAAFVFPAPFARASEPIVPSPVSAALPRDPMHATVHRLPNGLTVYLSPNPQEPRITAWIAVRAGAKNDPSDSTGMAHYLEHMLFKGSQRLGTLDYDKEKSHLERISRLYQELFRAQDPKARRDIYAKIDAENVRAVRYEVPNELDRLYKSMGFSGVNAHTSEESTIFESNFPANRAEAWARVETERFSRPVFRLFQTEIETVFEEKNRSMDNAEWILDEAMKRTLYKHHPYGQYTVLGSTEHLKNPSLAKMYAYFDAQYRPNNMALALSGDFDPQAMLALIQRTLGGLKPAELPPTKTWPLPKPKGTERVEVRYESEEHVAISWLTAPRNDPDADALAVMDMIFDNAQAGILNLHLNQAQRVKSSGSFPEFRNDAGSWTVWAAPKKGQTLEEAERLLLETVDKLKRGEFTDEDLRAVVTDFEVQQKRQLESNDSRAAVMADSFIGREEWARAVDRLERLRKVTRADVLRVAERYIGPDRVIAYRRQGKPEIPFLEKPTFTHIPIDPTRKSAFYAEIERLTAKPIEPRWLKEGRDYEVRVSSWGRLYFARNPFNDLFAVTLEFDRGQKQERNLCAALSLWSLAGAGTLSAEDYKRKLYGLGTSVGVSCGERTSAVSVSGLEAHFKESMGLLVRRFDEPNIASGTLDKMIDVEIGAHRDNKLDPGYVGLALGEFAMHGRDSVVLRDLTDAELRGLSEAKLREILRSVLDYRRDALYVGAGDAADLEGVLSAGRATFKPLPPWEPMPYVKPAAPRVLFAHREMVQARLGLYAADSIYNRDEAVDYQFYNAYMGGMSGVIFQEVREARALAYSAGGGYGTGERKGEENVLRGAAGCQADKTPETASLLEDLLRRMPASPERFALARKAVEEGYRTDVVRFRDIPGVVLRWERLGIAGGDPRPERFKKVLRYAQGDLERFARRFEAKPLTLYVLGDRGRIDLKKLGSLGSLEEKTIDDLFPY